MAKKSANARICIELEKEINKINKESGGRITKTDASKLVLHGYIKNKETRKTKKIEDYDDYGFN